MDAMKILIALLALSQFTSAFAGIELSRKLYLPYEEVISRLHEDVEAETDVVYMVNTGNTPSQCKGQIPNQHLLLLKRSSAEAPIFVRDSKGMISGIASTTRIASLPVVNGVIQHGSPVFKTESEIQTELKYVPVSSGISNGNMILTYSGIFRVNERRTNDMRKSTNTSQDPMQYSVYINGEYDEGNEARLALHGTPERFWKLLGKQRASSGCIRLHTDFSRWNQQFLFSKATDGQLVPKKELNGEIKNWNRKLHFPPYEGEFSTLKTATKLRVLIVFFDGYQKDKACP